MTTRILLAGDRFVLNELLRDALAARVDAPLDLREITLDWPDVPFGRIAEVDEASGSEQQMLEALDGAEICLTQMAPLTERILAGSPDLRLFGVGRGGPVNANLSAASRHGVLVTFAPGRNAAATAEHTVGLILAAARSIPSTHAELVGGAWRSDYYRYDSVAPEIGASTVGLVGLGAIGQRVATILRSFGAQVLAYDPYVDAASSSVELTDLDDLLRRSNILSLHARLTAETAGLIGREQLALLPRGAVLVNCARGGLLDYEALCDALDDGHLAAAGSDVFPEEPVPAGSRLLTTRNLVLTPHLAGASRPTAQNAAAILADDVARYLAGQSPRFVANPQAAGVGRG